MNRKPTGWRAGIAFALAIAAVLSLAACGGGGGGEELSPTPADETAGVEPEELDAMMLQADDLPQGFSYDVSSEVPSLPDMAEPEQRVAGRRLRSLLEESLQQQGKTVCIVSDLELYVSAEDAAARLEGEQQAMEEQATAVPAGEGALQKLDLPAMGDEADGFFLSAPRVSFCGWQSVQAEVVSLTFRKGRLLADVRTYTLGQGASTDQAIQLASALLTHIEHSLGAY
jgi:predicted small lipoprotein YifL